MPAFFLHPLSLSFVIGIAIFICSYCWSEKILEFFSQKIKNSQTDILDIMDKLFISQKREKIVKNCWIFSICLSLIVFLAFWPQVIVSLFLGVLTFLGSWIGIQTLLKQLWEDHCNKVVDQMVEALTIMCNSLKVGLSLPQAMDRVIKGYPGALAKEFQLILNKTQLGQSLEESLVEMGERVNRPDIDMLVSTVNILKESGGNLAETFFVMADTLRQRQKMEKKIKALTAQGLIQAKIISVIPFALIVLFYFMDQKYIAPLLFTAKGWVCLALVVLLVAIGGFLMKKMVQIKV